MSAVVLNDGKPYELTRNITERNSEQKFNRHPGKLGPLSPDRSGIHCTMDVPFVQDDSGIANEQRGQPK
jgi:hypothetical protein